MKKYTVFLLLFLLLLTVPTLITVFTPDRAFSDNENRTLQQTPALRLAPVLEGEFQTQLETWLSDQFPGRDLWMAGETLLKKAIGYRDIGGAYLGKDGFLLEQHPQARFDREAYQKNLGYLAALSAETGIPATALLIPCAASAMPEKLPLGADSYDADLALALAREALPGIEVPDLKAAFRAGTDGECYYRTDHHWNAAGVRIAYDCLSHGQGAYTGIPELFCDDFYGSTYSKTLDSSVPRDRVELFPVPDSVTAVADGKQIPVYDRTAAQRKDKYTLFLGGNHGIVTLTGGCSNGKTLLVLRDSFGSALAPLLSADYETVILVDLRYYPGSVRSLAETAKPDRLLYVYEMSGVAEGRDFVLLLL